MKKILVLVVMLLMVTGYALAGPVDLRKYDPNGDGKLTYDELIALGHSGGMLDDKLFSDFGCGALSWSTGVYPINGEAITVTPIPKPFNPGFQFQAEWNVLPGQHLGYNIWFNVEVIPHEFAINGLTATMEGYDTTATGVIRIAPKLNGGWPSELYDGPEGTTDHVSYEWNPIFGVSQVVGYIQLWGNTGTATLSDVTIRVNQESIPEPSTMLLLGSGLIGLAGYGRKKFFKK